MNSRLPRYPDGTEPSWYQPGGVIGQGLSRLGLYLTQKRPLVPVAEPWQMPGEFDPYSGQPDPLLESAQSPSLMDAYGASQNATRGFFTGDNPVDSVRRARQGLMEGNTFPDAHYGFARLAPEGSELQRGLDRVASQLTDPLTLAFPGGGGLARASIATGIGGGEGLRQVARLAGYDEQGQETAEMIGNAVGGLAPSVGPTIGRLGLRGLGALDQALNPADLRAAAPEAFQYGRGANQGYVPSYNHDPYRGVPPRGELVKLHPQHEALTRLSRDIRDKKERVIYLEKAFASRPNDPYYGDDLAEAKEELQSYLTKLDKLGASEQDLARADVASKYNFWSSEAIPRLSGMPPDLSELLESYRRSSQTGEASAIRAQVEEGTPLFERLYQQGQNTRAFLGQVSDDGETVTLWRGQNTPAGSQIIHPERTMQSWSTDPDVALNFATGHRAGRVANPQIIEARVPIRDVIVAIPGLLGEVLVRESTAMERRLKLPTPNKPIQRVGPPITGGADVPPGAVPPGAAGDAADALPRQAYGTDSPIGGYPRYEEGTIDPAFVEMIRRMTADENVGGGSDIKTKVPNRTKGVSRLPLRNQVQEPIVQTPQPRSVGSSIASGLGNILSVATTPLLTVPKTGNALIDFLGSGVEGLTSPLGLGFTALAPFTGGASLGLSGLAGQAARVGTRVGAEALVGATAGLASQKAQELLPEDTNPLIRGGVGLGAGLLAGAAGVKAFQRVPAFAPPKKAAAFGVKVARDVELEPGGSKFITDPVTNQPTIDYSQIPSQPTGAPVRGVPIAPDTVPNMLYAVVGNRQKVIDTGRLRTGPVTGSAGSALDEVVTLFDNRDTADQLASDFKTIASAFKKPRADVISDLQASAGRDGWQWAGLFTKANTTEEILADYFTSRSASKAVNPSLAVNPLEFASISEVRAFKPNEIGTVFVSKGSLQGVPDAATGTASGAMLTSDQTGSTPNLNLYGDVRLATGAQIQAVEADPAIRQFIQTLEDARVYAESNVGWEGLKKVRSAELTERVGKIRAAIAQARAAGKSTDEIDKLRSSLQKGQMATLELPPQFALNPAWLPAIMDKIQAGQAAGSNAPFTYFEGVHATEALNSLFTGNIFPNKSQMVDLQKVLGQQFTTALEAFSNPTARDKLFDILNIPRAVLASGDVSYPARQGLLLALADPITGAKMAMNAVRAYVSPKFAEEVNGLASGLTGTPLQQAKSNALLRWGMDVLGEGSSAEEQFRMGLVGKRMFGSNEAGRIMRASDRSYSTAGNYQRWTTGQKYLDEMIAIHLKPGEDVNDIKIVTDILANRITEADGEQLAKTLNILTGRTSWKKLTQGDLGQILNAGFFSPGFFASRIQAPFLLPARLVEYAKADPRKLLNPVSLYMSDPILKLQANMFGGMIAQGLGIYGMIQLAHAAGAPDVDMQLNPLKADFGKLKIGETRYDLWGGYTPMVRLVAQELTGERIGLHGEKYETNRAELVSQFMRSKVSPTVGFGWDVATGQNFTNQRVSFERNSIEEQTISAITPLFIQDIISGFKEDGVTGGIKALPSVFGTGVQSFTSINALKDSVASEITGGKKTNYKDLTGAERAAADQDQRLIMKKIEQEQGIPANSFAEAMRTLLEDRQNQERLYMWRGAQGMDTRKQISDNMAELQQITTAKREQALKDFNVPGAAEPTSALQEGLAAWRNLYNLSDIGAGQNIKTGKIDWDTFESLQQELFKSLTPEQTTFIEERARYSSTEEAQWWFNNRDYVNSTEYYKIPTQVFGKFSERVGRIDEGIQSYGDLITSVDSLKYSDPNKYRVLNSVLTSIKKDVAAQRKTMRTRNPELDVALYQLGRANTVLTPKAKNMMGGADAWVDSNTGQPD